MIKKYQNVKGTHDISPESTPIWSTVENAIIHLAKQMHISEIRFPHFGNNRVI